MNEPIPSGFGADGYPGIYGYENPLGWYSYKVVVKQQEQDYYNIYLAGAVSGDINYTDFKNPLSILILSYLLLKILDRKNPILFKKYLTETHKTPNP